MNRLGDRLVRICSLCRIMFVLSKYLVLSKFLNIRISTQDQVNGNQLCLSTCPCLIWSCPLIKILVKMSMCIYYSIPVSEKKKDRAHIIWSCRDGNQNYLEQKELYQLSSVKMLTENIAKL